MAELGTLNPAVSVQVRGGSPTSWAVGVTGARLPRTQKVSVRIRTRPPCPCRLPEGRQALTLGNRGSNPRRGTTISGPSWSNGHDATLPGWRCGFDSRRRYQPLPLPCRSTVGRRAVTAVTQVRPLLGQPIIRASVVQPAGRLFRTQGMAVQVRPEAPCRCGRGGQGTRPKPGRSQFDSERRHQLRVARRGRLTGLIRR
jgi:hypothetical protein